MLEFKWNLKFFLPYKDDEQRLADQEESEEPEPTPYNPLIFWPAALCDMTATSIQYIALTLTYASSFQMLRGK